MNANTLHDTLVAIFMSDTPGQAQDRLFLSRGALKYRIEINEELVGPLVARRLNGRRRLHILSPRALTYVRETIIDNSSLYPGPRLLADLKGANDASENN